MLRIFINKCKVIIMKKTIFSTLLLSGLMLFNSAKSQEAKTAEQVKQETYSEYSHWSLGINAGIPFTSGDMTSFSHDKTYFGFIGGVQLGYQFNPIFGISLTGDYGFNKAGSKKYEQDFILGIDNATAPWAESLGNNQIYFKDIYVKERYFMGGLHFDVNLINLFSRTYSSERRFALILSPAVYGQKFDPQVKQKSDDKEWGKNINKKINLGLGGDLAFRFRASSRVDLQLKCFANWIDNQHFDGIKNTASESMNNHKYNWMIGAQAGVIWKFGGKKKKDNILWAPTKFEPIAAAPVSTQKEEKPAPKPTPKPEPKPEVKKIVLPQMPAVHFEIGRAHV